MKRESHDDITFEYNQITEQIFIGTNLCCQIHFDKELLNKGITTVVSLEAEEVDSPFGVDFFTWIPVVDNTPPTIEQFEFGVSTLSKLLQMKKKIYVHCKHGHGRAPTMVAAYFIGEGAEVSEAIARIKEKRPVIHLEESQIKALEEFKRIILDNN